METKPSQVIHRGRQNYKIKKTHSHTTNQKEGKLKPQNFLSFLPYNSHLQSESLELELELELEL